jgi:hypothetical protein
MKFQVRIEGTTPMLQNRFSDEAAEDATSGTRTSSAAGSKGTPREQATEKLYLSVDGETLMVPQPNIFKSIMEGGRFFKNGRSKITTQKSSLFPGAVSLLGIDNPVEIPILHKEPWTIDTRAVRIPATGGRILCHRPCFHDWALEFELDVDEKEMHPKLVREIVDAAGKKIGLGDFRPDCKGMFGKYVVTKWEEAD